jgi:hypothetical protein
MQPVPAELPIPDHWHADVPGSRWFRADLHVHTLDDFPGGRIRWTNELNGSPQDPETQKNYSHSLLRTAIARGIEIVGLTPHSVQSGDTDQTSATWRVVEAWKNDLDGDGVPFREKIYAVFPGFEPSLSDGSKGVHLIFLFDSEIGRKAYIAAFRAVMGGVEPWQGGTLRNATPDAKTVFQHIRRLQREEGGRWNYLCLAPHAFSDKGLFSALKSQMLQDFPTDEVCALELGDGMLPEDKLDQPGTAWFDEGFRKNHHCLFHSSDAYILNSEPQPKELFELGSRFVLLKLAQPSIEALRQAFLASDSRLRVPYTRDTNKNLVLRNDLPDPRASDRPWLKSVNVRGGSSFFAGLDQQTKEERAQTFQLSPDFTCVIGGRMSGKSTFLDGLRVDCQRTLPQEDDVKKNVLDRANQRFLSGNPTVTYEIRGPINPTAEKSERWPAEFYTQRELQRAVQDQDGLRKLLFRLVPSETKALIEREEKLRQLDAVMAKCVVECEGYRSTLGVAEQALLKVEKARGALERFDKVGITDLTDAQHDTGAVQTLKNEIQTIQANVLTIRERVSAVTPPTLRSSILLELLDPLNSEGGFSGEVSELLSKTSEIEQGFSNLFTRLSEVESAAKTREKEVRERIQHRLVEIGGSSEDLNRFGELSNIAAGFELAHLTVTRARVSVRMSLRDFIFADRRRSELIAQHRVALKELAMSIEARFQGRIRLTSVAEGIEEHVSAWVRGLKERGISRWWNDHQANAAEPAIGPIVILKALKRNALESLGMSGSVAQTFREVMTQHERTRLRSLRSEDLHILEMRVNENPAQYRPMQKLSGGAQVSLLLSLLLEGENSTPLVIDQPEDELDKSYLLDTVLPALRRLKGKRQIVFATHDANIVVNGDADQVIFLKANSDFARIVCQGTIEHPAIKEAILDTLDGGSVAFELRKAKYGF